jgi:hypothetical protein
MSKWIEAVVRSGAAAAIAALALAACGDGAPDPAGLPDGPPSFIIAVVSGDNQPGRAGRLLPSPFVVRLTDDRGKAVANTTVTWTVTAGQGAFTEEGITSACWPPVSTTSVQTDAGGLAQVPFIPTWIGPVTVSARAPGASNRVSFTTDASDAGAVLRTLEGHHWVGKAGEWVDGTRNAEMLKVLLTDVQGNPVPNVAVTWAILSGDAWLNEGCAAIGDHAAIGRTRTGSDGTAFANVLPTTIGTTTIAAAVPGVLFSPVTFTIEVTAAVINLGEPWGVGGIGFFGPSASHSADVTVPVGATVEWLNHVETARIVSVGAPPGGTAVDSGELAQGERFVFVPNVAGTWEYIDQVSGATGRLTAQ